MKAKIFTRLLYRHWSSFTEFKRSHSSWSARTAAKRARDLTPGDRDVPPFNLGGQDMYAVSPDGQEVAYTMNPDPVEATSTNNEIYLVPIGGGTAKKISTSPGNDNTPMYSPDGNHIAWRSMARAGFEADKQALIIYQRSSGRRATRPKNGIARSQLRLVAGFEDDLLVRGRFWQAADLCLALDAKEPRKIASLHADDLTFGGNQLFFTRMSIAGA